MKYSDLLLAERECPFCNRLVSRAILENKTAFLTYSIAPYHPDHLLVCPKRHTEHVLDISSEELGDIDSLQKEGLRILNKLGYTDVSFLVREGMNSGKSVKHLHYHIIPNITLGAGDHSGADRLVLTENQIDELIQRLESVI